MTEPDPGDITGWLVRWGQGDDAALNRLLPAVYGELRRLASLHLRHERREHTLETAALAHEAYLRLIDQRRTSWHDRAHFFAVASQAMRRVLVDHARSRTSLKRGGRAERAALADLDRLPARTTDEWLVLDEALDHLSAVDAEQGRIVEMHFFGGLTHEEIAAVLGVSVPTVVRRWRVARAWLYRHLAPPAP